MTTQYEEHCQLATRFIKHLWDNDLLEKYHKKLLDMGIMVEDAPKEFDAFEYNYQYDGDTDTILK